MAESRTYNILGVVGTGGFGKVYRARLESGSGFSKDVAVKVLHDRNPDPDLLSRFRDEARILALLRDRAIVSVDPPTRLSGRWAVVMDFVDGQSAAALLREFGPFPPGVAIEIVGEIARVLDKAYRFKGPDGEALELLHRDVKPGNIQITPTGEIRLLDFGVARARFTGRESSTTRSISGTPGYIAPERLQGHEGPKGDVYSLGVVLWVLLTGESPADSRGGQLDGRAAEIAGDDPHLLAALSLASRMRRLDDSDRPTTREVERECRSLRQALPEPWLRDWAEQVPEKKVAQDELAGQQLSETLFRSAAGDLGSDYDPSTGSVNRTLLLGTGLMGFSALGVVVAVVLGVLAALALFVVLSLQPPPETVELQPVEPEPAVEPDVPDVDDPDAVADPAEDGEEGSEDGEDGEDGEDAEDGEDPDATDPAPDEPEPVEEPAPEPQPAPAPVVPRPVPTPDPEPDPEPVQPAEDTVPVTFRSVPWGARVFVDGVDLGPAPVLGHPLTEGRHQVEMLLGDQSLKKTIRVGARHPNSYRWAAADGADGWQSSFAR